MIKQQNTFIHDISASEIEYLRDQKLSNKQIAERVGCSANTISKYFPKERKEKVKLTEEDYEHIVALYNDKYSPKYIAAQYNCCVPTVYRILKRMGIDFSNKKQDDIPEKETIEKNVEEAPAYNPCVDEPKSSCLTMHEVKIYSGHSGDYLVDPIVHNIRLPEICKVMDKKELGFYIRDLMAVWKEM